MRRYRRTRAWPVGALALVAASGAVLTTGALSSALDGAPESAFAAGIGQGAASLRSGIEAHASTAPAPARPAFAPPPGPGWQVQVGSFRNPRSAEAHLRALEEAVPRLTKLNAVHQLRGGFNRVRIGGIGDGSAALDLCARIRSAGSDCFVVGPES